MRKMRMEELNIRSDIKNKLEEINKIRLSFYRDLEAIMSTSIAYNAVLCGATMVAMLSFTGSVWSNPDKKMLEMCYSSLRLFSMSFSCSVLAVVFNYLVKFLLIKNPKTDDVYAAMNLAIIVSCLSATLSFQIFVWAGYTTISDLYVIIKSVEG